MRKFELAAVMAIVAAWALWVENSHRIAIEAPMASDAASLAAAPACPDNDKVPYSAKCLAFLKGATELGMRWRIKADNPPALMQDEPSKSAEVASKVTASGCPSNDSVPYTARCLAYLNGSSSASGPH